MPDSFIFPKGIRFPGEEELPENPDKPAIVERLKNVSIEVGYVLMESKNTSYSYYAEINVSAPDIWNVFLDLARMLLPGKAALILGEKGQEEQDYIYGLPVEKETLLRILEPYQSALTNDGHIQFGIIHHEEDTTEEVFIHPSKYFTVWTNDARTFRTIMNVHNIPEAKRLSFIDEYPRITLADYPGRTQSFREVMDEILSKFPVLVKRNNTNP